MTRKRTTPITPYTGSNGNGAKAAFSNGKNKVGRPGVYNPLKHPQAARKLIGRTGMSHEDLAAAFCISGAAFSQWKDNHPEFLKSLNEGWDDWTNGRVKKALAQVAVGYTIPEEKIFCNALGEVTRVTTNRYYPPNVAAICFWAVNKSKGEFMHVSRTEHTGVDGKPIATQDVNAVALLKELLTKTEGGKSLLHTLKENIEHIQCANSQPC